MSNRYTVTQESAVVVIDGRVTTVKRGAPNFNELRRALLDKRWDDVKAHLRADTSLNRWAKGRFTVKDGNVYFDSAPVPSDLNTRIVEMATSGEDPTPLFKFWERLQNNPSYRSVEQLWRFLNLTGIPLTAQGTFLAYKGVRDDFMDCHSGKHENRPGALIKMPRNQISDDPNHACHAGLHVGSREYATGFGPRVVICEVDPADVVCVPHDCSSQKMRVCQYKVVGMDGGDLMPSTSISPEEMPEQDEQYDGTTQKAPRKAPAGKWAKFDALDQAGLMNLTLDELRKYAFKGLKMVGVYRTPGGKFGLVSAIVKARD